MLLSLSNLGAGELIVIVLILVGFASLLRALFRGLSK